MPNKWYKNKPDDVIWWKETDTKGEFIFSFDRKTEFNLFRDYPHRMTEKQIKLFDREYPFWASFFEDRR